MKNLLLTLLLVFSYAFAKAQTQNKTSYVEENYTKTSYSIPMRDGVKLYTTVYTPKDQSKKYPMVMQRTPYSVAPYEADKFPTQIGPNEFMMKDGYIFVYQDVRGRWMSEGDYNNMTPNITGNQVKNKKDIDESSDTYDTIAWLLKKVANNNGKVGQWGISYPGFYTAAALPDAHPALVASSPQAPIGDFFFDDFHHMGATLQSYLLAYPLFGSQTEPTTKGWYEGEFNALAQGVNVRDAYQYHMQQGNIKKVAVNVLPNNTFLKEVIDHPNYDDFWQKRSIIPHLKNVNHAVMTVGGWFDAEDLYGPLQIYKNLERNNPKIKQNMIVMGPWSHGNWSREPGNQMVNHIHFGDSLSTWYQRNVEEPFFEHHLKGAKNPELPEAMMFDTGLKEWKKFNVWPPKNELITLSFDDNKTLRINDASNASKEFNYTSDPNNPVPFRSEITPVSLTPRAYMTDDQRHASRRPDVLTFKSATLTEDFTLAGEIQAALKVILKDINDADFIVKIIDVYPDDTPNEEFTPKHITLAGYQQLVRAETFRGRFRNDFSIPEAFTMNKVETVAFPLQDILHTFKKGHQVMIQIHSTWFPYIDQNPQIFSQSVLDIEPKDYKIGNISITSDSKITIGPDQGNIIPLQAVKMLKK